MSESLDLINKVVIVGGGTAGWLTAANLAKKLNSRADDSVQITVVESPNIPTIGVGEGTWPTMRKTLSAIGVKEHEFLQSCHATFKQGTCFVNWKNTPKNGAKNYYYNLFSSLYDPADFNLSPYWALGLAGDVSYADAVSIQGKVCEAGLAPKNITNKAYEGVLNYAYHLDAGKFTDFLKQHAVENLGVKHILANVEKVNIDSEGFIESISTDSADVLSGDFFIDCTGFKSLLLGEALGIEFKSISNFLLTDYAVAIQAPYENEDSPIPCTTFSTAQNAGWIWDIGLSSRRGLGYVYSSNYIDHDSAEECLRNYIGPQADNLEARRIKMNIGYREKFWHKNCVAIGLSAAFIEPLEASAIFLIEAASNMIADQFPRVKKSLPLVEKKFNKSFDFRWNRTLDFIKMHYYLSKRSDSQFWLDNKDPRTAPESMLERLEHWKYHPISQYDFDNVYEPFPQESYQYILHGMEFEQEISCNRSSFAMIQKAKEAFNQVEKLTRQINGNLPKHRDLIQKVLQHGFQNI